MKDYLLLFRVGPRYLSASPEELQKIMLRSKDWVSELAKAGKLNGVVRLTREGAVLTGTTQFLSNGPYREGEDIVSGYLAIKAGNLEEAVQVAKGSPVFDYEGIMEVREVAPN